MIEMGPGGRTAAPAAPVDAAAAVGGTRLVLVVVVCGSGSGSGGGDGERGGAGTCI